MSVRCKFMACLERRNGRVSTITRKDLISFIENYNKNPYEGITLKMPTWLIHGEKYRQVGERGVYRLPWQELDDFYKENQAFKANLDKQDTAGHDTVKSSESAT